MSEGPTFALAPETGIEALKRRIIELETEVDRLRTSRLPATKAAPRDREGRTIDERHRLALDAGAIGLWDWDIPNDRVIWSDRVYEFHGLAPETFGGTSEDFRRQLPRFQSDNFDANVALVAKLEALAKEKGVTTAQLALAWVLHQGDDIVPIPGARKVNHLEQNAAAADIVLSKTELTELTETISLDQIAGKRYSDASLAMTNL